MDAKDKVRELYKKGWNDDQVAEWLFGPQWRMAATPKDGWWLTPSGWAPLEPKRATDRLHHWKFSNMCQKEDSYGGFLLNYPGGTSGWFTTVRNARRWFDDWLSCNEEFWALPEADRREIIVDADQHEMELSGGPITARTLSAQQQQP